MKFTEKLMNKKLKKKLVLQVRVEAGHHVLTFSQGCTADSEHVRPLEIIVTGRPIISEHTCTTRG